MNNQLSREELVLLSTSGTELLKSVGLGGDVSFERLSGGRNNRVYRVAARDATIVLKWYFRHADDQRDRLNAEYLFCEYAVDCGATCVAKPLGRDNASQLAAYSLVEGQRLACGQIETNHTEQAIAFLHLLNEHRAGDIAKRLPIASEACFSLQEHVDCVSARVARVQGIAPSAEHHGKAVELVDTTIAPALVQAVNELQAWARKSDISMRASLTAEQRCVSPSDFGFHNALLREHGELSFFDFEYAGWDDPAKLLCDFYCQPQVPALRETWRQFADLTATLAGDTELERQRQALLFPLYQVKWCCILLNEFVATARDRRKFAEQQPADLALQLEKAKRLADQLPQVTEP
ncbi:MAG: aminoglycoside phosphotransferase family protein [Planctomycetota bacterium]|nr:aminoglycoside phosphotransferase family protein [Planctomycetota bacterium]